MSRLPVNPWRFGLRAVGVAAVVAVVALHPTSETVIAGMTSIATLAAAIAARKRGDDE